MNTKLLTKHNLEPLSLKGGCRGSCESTLDKMPQCWKSYVAAQILKYSFGEVVYYVYVTIYLPQNEHFENGDLHFNSQVTFSLKKAVKMYYVPATASCVNPLARQ